MLAARPTVAWSRLLAASLFEGRPLTARTRVLNPLVFATLAAARALPLATPRAPLYLVGSGRSGTTWLGKMLALHPEVGFLNEPKALWHAAIPDEDLVGTYTQTPARLVLGASDATPRARRVLAHGYGAFLVFTRRSRVLDKYPELVFRAECVQALFPDARFLVLQRSGAETCRSIAAWSALHGTGAGAARADWWGRGGRKLALLARHAAESEPEFAGAEAELAALTRPEDAAALEWILATRAGRALAARHPGAVLTLRYEELVRHPRALVTDLLAFAGLAPDERVLAYAERTAAARPPGWPLALAPVLRAAFERTQADLERG